jgi:hypothetical protein
VGPHGVPGQVRVLGTMRGADGETSLRQSRSPFCPSTYCVCAARHRCIGISFVSSHSVELLVATFRGGKVGKRMRTTTTVKLRPASVGRLLACVIALAVVSQVIGACEDGACPEEHAAATSNGLLGGVQAASCTGKTETYPKNGKLRPVSVQSYLSFVYRVGRLGNASALGMQTEGLVR